MQRCRGPGVKGHMQIVSRLPHTAWVSLAKFLHTVSDQKLDGGKAILTHGYILYVIGMHTESIIYSRQRYFKLSSDFFDPRCSLLLG